MEFDEINALINIERENYQNDLKRGTIIDNIRAISRQIKEDKAERAALYNAMKCAREVELAMERLGQAMRVHARSMQKAYLYL
jgi:hypothetical protein